LILGDPRLRPDGLIRRGASLDYYGQSVDPKTREMGIGDQKAIREEENRQTAGGDERRRGRQETQRGQTSLASRPGDVEHRKYFRKKDELKGNEKGQRG